MNIYRLTIRIPQRHYYRKADTRIKYVSDRSLNQTISLNRHHFVKVERAMVVEFEDVTAEYK